MGVATKTAAAAAVALSLSLVSNALHAANGGQLAQQRKQHTHSTRC